MRTAGGQTASAREAGVRTGAVTRCVLWVDEDRFTRRTHGFEWQLENICSRFPRNRHIHKLLHLGDGDGLQDKVGRASLCERFQAQPGVALGQRVYAPMDCRLAMTRLPSDMSTRFDSATNNQS